MSKKRKSQTAGETQDAAEISEASGAEETVNDTQQEAPQDGGQPEQAQENAADAIASQLEELKDKLRRNMAEFDNFRKRTEKEKAGRFEMGQRSVVERLLPIVDIFEKGLGTLAEEQKSDAFVQGMEQTHKQLSETLAALGVTPIEAVGSTFNPDFHNAVMHVDDESQPENTVVEEFQKGYLMNGTVIRYSMVKVAN